jgi:thermitase
VARFLPLLTGALLAAVIFAPAAAAANRIVIKRRPGLSAAERADLRADAGVALTKTLSISGLEVVRAQDGDRARALADLREDPDVVWAQPDRRRHAATDPMAGLLWALNNTGQSIYGSRGTADADIDAPEAWTVTTGAGVTVAVVDTGADLGHPDLASRLLAGYDWVDGDANPTDANGHGTHVAGTIAAAENGTGVVGVAPDANVIPLRVLDAEGSGWGTDVAAAFDWAGDRGVRVVNASLGADGITAAEQLAIQDHPETLYVVAAGNGGVDGVGDDVDTTPEYPCAYPEANVLCVGATDFKDRIAGFSNFGATGVDLFAPGTRIVSTFPRGFTSEFDSYYETGDGYEMLQGTSMATPHVAGAAALVAAANPTFSAAQIKAALMDTADPIATLAGKSVTGARLNAAAALGVAAPPPTDVVRPGVPGGLVATPGETSVRLDWTDVADPDVAGYRIYRRATPTPGGPILWQAVPLASASTSDAVVSSLPAGQAVELGVSAVDAAGNESAVSTGVFATPLAPVATPTPTPVDTSTPAPTATPTPVTSIVTAALARVSALRMTGRIVLSGHRRSATLSFNTTAATRITVGMRREAGKRWRGAGTKTAQVSAGTSRWRVGRTLAGLRLRPGRYQLTLTAPAGPATVQFSVR